MKIFALWFKGVSLYCLFTNIFVFFFFIYNPLNSPENRLCPPCFDLKIDYAPPPPPTWKNAMPPPPYMRRTYVQVPMHGPLSRYYKPTQAAITYYYKLIFDEESVLSLC